MSDEDDGLKLEELAEAAEVSPRTVRYYVQRALLPAPMFRGRDTAYGPEHLVRLRAIKRLQAAHLPLDLIQSELARRSDAEIAALAEGHATVPVSGLPDIATLSVASSTEPQRWTRWVLAPGLELHLSDDADSGVLALAARLREAATVGATHTGDKSFKGGKKKGATKR